MVTAKCLIQSKFASDSATDEYTCPSNTRTIIDKFTVTNTDSGAVTISIYLIPSGGSAGDSNLIVKALSLSAGATDDVEELKNHILAAGDTISVVAGAASKMTIRASGRECT